jgi:hypothetical protein
MRRNSSGMPRGNSCWPRGAQSAPPAWLLLSLSPRYGRACSPSPTCRWLRLAPRCLLLPPCGCSRPSIRGMSTLLPVAKTTHVSPLSLQCSYCPSHAWFSCPSLPGLSISLALSMMIEILQLSPLCVYSPAPVWVLCPFRRGLSTLLPSL